MTQPLAPPGTDRITAAERYWRACCLLSAVHLFGWSWPLPGRPTRTRLVGHWGCNPGIAWTVGHLAAALTDEDVLLVVGTGHATGFMFAHQALAEQMPPEEIAAASARYGRPGGDPSEILGLDDVPYVGGELGPALAVGQGIAAADPGRLVVTVVGDGECETPAALAALAHRDVLLADTQARWLPVVNANGARMGGRARFDRRSLASLLSALGYHVVTSNAGPVSAGAAASTSLAAVAAGERAVWISETDKGWPAPPALGHVPFRGHHAHKATAVDLDDHAVVDRLRTWMNGLAAGVFDTCGVPAPDVTAIARRSSLRLARRPEAARTPQGRQPRAEHTTGWRSPAGAADDVMAGHRVLVLSPDEAGSNRLRRCLDAGLVREVLAEEVCSAWAWGSVEAGRHAVFATYEAFAPLAASQLAQYAKLVHTRRPCGRPPLVVLLSSLGWANSPTHQNTDLAGTVMARPWPRMRLLCPLGASSTRSRVDDLLATGHDTVAVVACSKQDLLDVPDAGTPLTGVRLTEAPPELDGTIVAVGDVAVTEAVAAMTLAAEVAVNLAVVAVADVTSLRTGRIPAPWLAPEPLVGVSWCAPPLVTPALWAAAQRIYPLAGYHERWGATPWETLCRNGMDRASLLEALAGQGCPLPPSFPTDVRGRHAAAGRDGGVPRFACPPLNAEGIVPDIVPALLPAGTSPPPLAAATSDRQRPPTTVATGWSR